MFSKIDLNETAFSGTPGKNSSTPFIRLIQWITSVKFSKKAKYLKCIVGTSRGVAVTNISKIEFSDKLLQHTSGGQTRSYENNIRIHFVEDENQPAMTIATVAKIFDEIANLCNEKDVDVNTLEVFCISPDGKPTRSSCWFYDDNTDTAVIARNMDKKEVEKFMNAAEKVIVKLVSKPDTSIKDEEELNKIHEKIAKYMTRASEISNRLGSRRGREADLSNPNIGYEE